jgi:hypothetical protein
MIKPLNEWSEVELKAGIYDRQTEISIFKNELAERWERKQRISKEMLKDKKEVVAKKA